MERHGDASDIRLAGQPRTVGCRRRWQASIRSVYLLPRENDFQGTLITVPNPIGCRVFIAGSGGKMIRSEENTQALIFDVDGTLYDQGKLRRRMFFELLCRFVKKPRLVRDIQVLYRFRKNREILSKENDNSGCLETRQYEEVAHELGVDVEKKGELFY